MGFLMELVGLFQIMKGKKKELNIMVYRGERQGQNGTLLLVNSGVVRIGK